MVSKKGCTVITVTFCCIFSVSLSRELPVFSHVSDLPEPNSILQTNPMVRAAFAALQIREFLLNYTDQQLDSSDLRKASISSLLSSSSGKKGEVRADAPLVQENNNEEKIVGISDILQINFVPFLIDNVINPLITHVLADGNIYSYLNGSYTATTRAPRPRRRSTTTPSPKNLESATEKNGNSVKDLLEEKRNATNKLDNVSTTSQPTASAKPTMKVEDDEAENRRLKAKIL